MASFDPHGSLRGKKRMSRAGLFIIYILQMNTTHPHCTLPSLSRIGQSKMLTASVSSRWVREEQGRVNATSQASRPWVRWPEPEMPNPSPSYFQFYPDQKGLPAFLPGLKTLSSFRTPGPLYPKVRGQGSAAPQLGGAESQNRALLENNPCLWKQHSAQGKAKACGVCTPLPPSPTTF